MEVGQRALRHLKNYGKECSLFISESKNAAIKSAGIKFNSIEEFYNSEELLDWIIRMKERFLRKLGVEESL